MNVVIRNLPQGSSEEEIRELLQEHGVPVTSVTLTNEGNAENCVAVLALDTNRAGADALVKMLDGKFWRGKTLAARAQNMFTGEGLNKT
ncbi:MAG TPA: RNA-binding protein [Gammaproteobacteria bacterium]|nr:RNA-binding protein [Gammaproteobacteria bacterium]